MQLKVSLFVLGIMMLSLEGLAQHSLHVKTLLPEEQEVLKSFPYRMQQPSAEEAKHVLDHLLERLQEDGYLLARLHLFSVADDSSKAVLRIGKQFKWVLLEPGNVDPAWLSRTAYRQNSFRQRPFRHAQVRRLLQQLLKQAENKGYPFASAGLDSIGLDSTALQARLRLDTGPLIYFDTLEVQGTARLSASYLAAHLGIKPGQPYRHEQVGAVAGRLRQLPFVKLREVPSVRFQNKQATVYLALEEKKASRLDGILGFLPDPQVPGSFLFTGQLDLLLQNPFGTGKKMALQWQRLSPAAQSLEAAYTHPYLLGTPFSWEFGFSLLKEAEAFVNRQLSIETQLKQGAYNTLRLRMEQKDSRLLSEAAAGSHAGIVLQRYGIGFGRQRLNDPLLPREGYAFSFDMSGGKKKVRSLPASTNDSVSLLPEAAMQYSLSANFSYYWPLSPRLVWAHELRGALLSDKQLFQNDLYRLGGLTSLRGFQEKNFFVSDFVLSRMELRYLSGSETFFFLFYDQAWMAQLVGNLHAYDWPSGFGAGLSLGTKAGTFNFVYGLGRSESQSFGLSTSQVHFGYINRF